MLRLAVLALIAASWCLGLWAQTRMAVSSMRPTAGARQPAPAPASNPRQTAIVIGGRSHHHSFGRRGFFYGAPYFYSDFYEPYDEEYVRPAPAPQGPAPAPAPEFKSEPIPDPVLLELRGDDWVRVTSFSHAQPTEVNTATKPSNILEAQKKLPPAILVYRDGHSEELSSYSIIGDVIYAKSDYWSNGVWTKNIQIADLDIPATLRENQQRGVKFELPSGPNEVMLRP
jgi:hypothetical protein